MAETSVRDRLLLFGGVPLDQTSSVVLFAGWGGTCLGIQWATGVSPFLAVNHNRNAVENHALNHPDTIHMCEDIRAVKPKPATRGRRVDLLGASPDCTHFSLARGGVPKSKKIRGLAWQVTRWAAQTSPDVIVMENVREFTSWGPLTRKWRKKNADRLPEAKRYRGGQPIKARAGETFRAFVESLRKLGYDVAWWMLAACDYGTPTTRERLVFVARRDGLPITKPPPTHGPPDDPRVLSGELEPYRTAAECIDFNLPMCSIFASREEAKAWAKANNADGIPSRPLAAATMDRIREGMFRFVLGERRPFLVNLTHGVRIEDVDEPARTITAAHRGEKAVAAPILSRYNGARPGESRCASPEDPLSTVDTSNRHALLAPVLTKAHSHGWDANGSGVRPVDAPHGAIVAKDASMVAAASLLNLSHGGRPEDIAEPARTITSEPKGGDRLVVATHLMPHYGASVGASVEDPCPTITAGGGGHQVLVAASLVTNTTGHAPSSAEEPLATIATGGHHMLVGAGLVNTRNGEREGQAPRVRDLGEPAPTVTAQGSQGAVAGAWVVKHYGGPNGHPTPGSSVEDPCPTISARDSSAVGVASLHPAEPAVLRLSPLARERARKTLAFLTAYYSGGGTSAACDEPAPTVVTKARLGLVTVIVESSDGVTTENLATVTIDGAVWIIVDICMRMLTPRELARCQGFPDSYLLTGTKSEQIARIGNSFPPQLAEAAVRANLPRRDDGALAAK